MKEVLLDSLLDSLKLVPFLFLSFVIMELIEHKLTNTSRLAKMNKFGPLAGSFLGIVPQCGFSALASNLYAARVITLGTLFSGYLSNSFNKIYLRIYLWSSSRYYISKKKQAI